MELDSKSIREMDYFLRDIISNVQSQVDFQLIGGFDGLSPGEQQEFLKTMRGNVVRLYDSLNKNIVEKSRKMQELFNIILETKQELERERNELKKRNQEIEQDLRFAKNIQRQVIPSASRDPRLGLFYKPMDQLGGDFFDITEFREPDRIAFFVSDVSGHGIPASLVTMIIKSILVQQRASVARPSAVMARMNRILFDMTLGNFVTGFLGYMDLSGGVLTYANAGHNHPVLVSDAGVRPVVPSRKHIPMAIMGNEELGTRGLDFADDQIVLEPGTKLLIYTDGLTEAVPVVTPPGVEEKDFESAAFRDALMKHRKLPAQEFIGAIYRELESFRGSDRFEDDICMICYDYVTPVSASGDGSGPRR